VQGRVRIEIPAGASDADLELVHDPGYIALVRLAGSPGYRAGDLPARALVSHGPGTEDDPVFAGMHEAAAMIAGASLAAARAVWTSAARHAASIAGGLHHAMAGRASGFCVYNDRAIAIAWLVDQGAERIANLELTIDGQRAAHAAIHALAHEVAGGRWLLTGGGGYQHVQVVPRSWTHLLFEAAGSPLDPETPTPGLWREYVDYVTGQASPGRMTEDGAALFAPFDTGYDPAEPVDRAIMAARKAVFPLHGLMP
jgi:acetoin utilization deacetylase AcuC-like enzyme